MLVFFVGAILVNIARDLAPPHVSRSVQGCDMAAWWYGEFTCVCVCVCVCVWIKCWE